jgi:tetratricopeptide (TPR) repeat protein
MSRWGILALGLVLSIPRPGVAQDAPAGAGTAPEEARAHFEEGSRAFEVGDYARSAEEFRAAYEITHHPDLLFNMYSALERQGDTLAAADALEAYLRDGAPAHELRTSLQARLARLRARLAEERATDAEARLVAEREAQRRAEERRVAEEAAARERAAAGGGGGGVHPAGIGVLVGGGVLLASFGVFAALAAVENDNLASTCAPGCDAAEVSTLSAFNLVADISWIAGAVVAATGLVLIFVLPGEGESASAAFAPWVAPGGGGAVAAGRF